MGFLAEIVASTRRAVARPEYGAGLPEPPDRPALSLATAIQRDRASGSLLVEYKRVSPGRQAPTLPDRSIAEFVSSTSAARVTGFSCIATEPVFRGTPRDVAELVTSVREPVLFKDFVVDARQVTVAARTGARAVLLIARLEAEGHLTTPLATLADAAHGAGLEVVLELHHRSELSRVSGVAADVYGVNARNLDSLEIDRPTALRTLREAGELGLRPLLGLSGVETPEDARAFWDAEADGILVGTSVARSSAPAHFLQSLRRPRGGTVS